MARPELVPDPVPVELPTSEAPPSQEPISPGQHSPPLAGSHARPETRNPSRVLVAGLAIALLITGLALVNRSREAAQLSGAIAVLEAELAAAASEVGAYQIRFEQVRGEVEGLLSRLGALNSLVTRDVVPEGSSDAGNGATPAVPDSD